MRTYKKVGFGSLRYIHTVDMCRAFKYIPYRYLDPLV